MRIYHSNRIDGWINQAECLCELHGAEKAVEVLLLDEERFKQSARYIFAIGCYYSLSNEVSLARDYVGRAIKMDPSLKTEFAEGLEFDVLWDSF